MPVIKRPLSERLFDRLAPPNEHGCELRNIGINRYGYSIIKGVKKKHMAHRVSWVMFNWRRIPKNREIMHLCERFYPPGDHTYKRCINPEHLKLATRSENMIDAYKNKRNIVPIRAKVLTSSEEIRIRNIKKNKGRSNKFLSVMFECSESTIANVINNK